jgi:hypothetical protein
MDPMIRGTTLPLTARFILGNESLKSRVPLETLAEVTRISMTKPDIWAPRTQQVRLLKIIDEASPDEESAYRNLVEGGEWVANEAISTFLKLLLRVLSPKQFARKFPDIWLHEHKGGYVEAALGDHNTMVITIRDVKDFSHIGPVSVGFVGTALRALGLKDLKIRDVGWTRADPGPNDVRMEISWRQ